ncbi:Pdk3 [Symbiodinium sp. CCMP2592]|nr:Pdk3 [Symbiodinium sp. CCMP2592]
MMDFLHSYDCPVTEQTLHTVAIKFWYQQPVKKLASLAVFPPEATYRGVHDMIADREWSPQKWHRELAYCLPLTSLGNTHSKQVQDRYGSILQRRIFHGGGPFMLEHSDCLVPSMLTRLGFLDSGLNSDIREAMFLFMNGSHNKSNLRRVGLLDKATLPVSEASALLHSAFLSNRTCGWQRAPADDMARKVLVKVLRWHPDKWSPAVQRFPLAEQPVLLSRVKDVTQRILEEKRRFCRDALRFSELWEVFKSKTYVQNFKQALFLEVSPLKIKLLHWQLVFSVLDFEDKHGFGGLGSEEYHALTNGIFNQHRGTMLDVAKGVFEFNEDLNKLFGPDLELAELRHLDLIQDIERSLDEFFTNRLTLRLMISHVQALNANKTVNSDGEAMVGVVNVSTHPITILSRAYVATRFMCMRDFQMAPDLLVNGTMHDEYVLRQDVQQQHFAYVHTHLFYIFLELVKNAARASIERVQTSAGRNGGRAEIPSMNVTVPEEVGIWDHERSVKLADRGTGMNRSVLGKAFSYFYSSVKARPTVAAEVSDFDRRMPLAGFGFGLPISRVMARYFAGDVDVNSIPGQGTDVYIYL